MLDNAWKCLEMAGNTREMALKGLESNVYDELKTDSN